LPGQTSPIRVVIYSVRKASVNKNPAALAAAASTRHKLGKL